jgi:cystathionine gamma-synthase
MAIPLSELEKEFTPSTKAIHVDDRYAGADLAPALHLATTFRYSYNPDELVAQPPITVSTSDMGAEY